MSVSAKRVGLATLAFSLVLFSSGGLVGAVVAQQEDCNISSPESMRECREGGDPGLNPFEGLLQNLYAIAKALLQYSGFVAVFAGATLWLTADKNSSRGQTGLWLFVGGLMLIVLYFGMTALIGLMKSIATGSGV